uniref:Uncharacterized protein n=1 Tax=Theileria annulata TaxID=5874 RepID=A0A3B0MQ88_THEAN
MQFNPTSNVTLFLSVRKGLENCILNEIKHNKFLNNFYKIHKNKFQNSQDSFTHPITKPNNYNFSITENTDSYNRATGLDNKTSSVQLSEEFEDTNNKWLRIYNNNKPTEIAEEKTTKLSNSVSVKSNNVRDYLDINLQKGGLEIKCNFEWLIKSSLLLKSAESIWLRIGNPFRCHTKDQLTSFISKFPWFNYFLSSDSVDKVPLRIISRNSKLWSSHIVRDCVTKGIKLSLNSELKLGNNQKTENCDNLNKTGYSEDSCISVTINRNTCYTAIQFSGRLSPRFYNYLDKFNNNSNTEDTVKSRIEDIVRDTTKDYYNHIPLWSLSGVRKTISKSFNTYYSTNLTENSLDSYDSKRTNYIKFQNLLTNDFVDTSDSLVAAFLHNKRLLKIIDSDSTTQTIWDPFCGTGLVICELISLILSLPNYTLENTNTITSLAKTFFTQNETQIKSLFDQYINNLGQKTKTFNIVGSDTSLVKLTEANSKISKFISYYKDILDSSLFQNSNLS